MGTRVAASLMLLVLPLAATARDAEFAGIWSNVVQLCDRDHECTPQELKDPDVHPETCDSSFTILQTGSRLCGAWDSGCSFGQGSSGVLTGNALKRSAEIEVGESTAFNAGTVFPKQDFIRQYVELRRGKLHLFHVDDKGMRHAEEVLERMPGLKPSLEQDQDFLAQCQAGVDFKPE